MSGAVSLLVQPHDAGKRLDVVLSEQTELSRSAVAALCEEGAVTVDGKPASKNLKLKEGSQIQLILPKPTPCEAIPQDIPLSIVYEDEDLLVIDKPSGMVVHPAPGNPDGTLVNALLAHCKDSLSGIGGKLRPGIVHRIDKDTSGLLVVAKNDRTHAALSAGLSTHSIGRVYHALVRGGFSEDSGTVDLPIGRHPKDRKRMAVIRDGTSREAVTHWRVLERFGAFTYLELRLETGRTHQIRVHMSHLGHPLLGDPVYGGSSPTPFEKKHASLLCGQALHAKELTFVHPATGEGMHFETPLPEEFRKILEILRSCQQ